MQVRGREEQGVCTQRRPPREHHTQVLTLTRPTITPASEKNGNRLPPRRAALHAARCTLCCTSESWPMFSLSRVKLSLLAPSPSEASRMAFSRAGASVPTSVSSGKNLQSAVLTRSTYMPYTSRAKKGLDGMKERVERWESDESRG